jgi:excinuclease ABC subunit C
MDGLFSCRAFTGFGPSSVGANRDPPALWKVEGRRAGQLRRQLRELCPRRPGVYGMLNADTELIYVGKAKSLRARLLSYFRPKSRDAKAGRIARQTRTIAWEPAPSEFAALLRELELIRRWQPRFNVQGQPRRHRRTYICLGRWPAPYLFLARRPSATILAHFGPVFAGRRTSEAVRRLNDRFGLRDCPQSQEMIFAEEAELFPVLRAPGCLRHEIGTCLGPCVGACSRTAYLERVRAVQAFLDGTDISLLSALATEMAAASAGLAFERAAALRDQLDVLRRLHTQLERVRRARAEHSFIYPVRGPDRDEFWYLIHHGRVIIALPRPRTALEFHSVAERIEEVFAQDETWTGPPASEVIDSVLLVAAWFRRHPEERDRVLNPCDILAACRRNTDRSRTRDR